MWCEENTNYLKMDKEDKHYLPPTYVNNFSGDEEQKALDESVAGSVDMAENESRLWGYACVASGMLV